MSKELLSRSIFLDQKIDQLNKNKKLLFCCLEKVDPRESKLIFRPTADLKEDDVYIPLSKDEFKQIAFLLNEMNEKKLAAAESEFKSIFKQE